MKQNQKNTLYSEPSDYYTEFQEDWKKYEEIKKSGNEMQRTIEILDQIDKKITYIVIILLFILLKVWFL